MHPNCARDTYHVTIGIGDQRALQHFGARELLWPDLVERNGVDDALATEWRAANAYGRARRVLDARSTGVPNHDFRSLGEWAQLVHDPFPKSAGFDYDSLASDRPPE
jgi:hypothetical protein